MLRVNLTLFIINIALGACCIPVAFTQSTSEALFAVHDGDKVVFYGDSTTEQREYTADVEAFVLTRFPRWKVSFHNAGVGGDKVTGSNAGPIDLRID